MTTTALPDDKQLLALEQKFDPEMRFRPLNTAATTLVGGLLIALSLFHYYTAGFGLLQEITHRGVHLAFVLGLIFLVFPHRQALLSAAPRAGWASPGGLPRQCRRRGTAPAHTAPGTPPPPPTNPCPDTPCFPT